MKKLTSTFTLLLLFGFTVISQVTFTEYPLGETAQRVTGVASSDFDQDGDIDIITCLRTENRIVAYINNGDNIPSFESYDLIPDIQSPFYINYGDINQDGLDDLVVSQVESNKIAVFVNPGNLSQAWTSYILVENFGEPHGIIVVDLNGDNLVDIAGTAASDNTIAFWINNGDTPDTWEKFDITNNFNYTQGIDACDIDNDGDNDIVASALQSNSITLWLNNGDPNAEWEEIIIDNSFPMAHDTYTTDINGDGFYDILGVGYGNNQVALWLNSGNSPLSFTKTIIDNNCTGALTVRTGDLDNDGDEDIISCAWIGMSVAWHENLLDQGGSWNKTVITSNMRGAWPLSIADINNDNDMDILVGADKLGGGGINGTFCLFDNNLNITGIISNNKNQFNFYYNKINNAIDIKSTYQFTGLEKIQIFDSSGRKLFLSNALALPITESVIKLPSSLKHTGLVHLILFDHKRIITKRTLFFE